jgi:hypothetical protein
MTERGRMAMAIQTISKGDKNVAYETKVVLTALARLVKAKAAVHSDKSPYRDIYEEIVTMANVEGVVLEPFDED